MALVEPCMLPSADLEESEVLTPPRQQTIANMVRPMPDVVITVLSVLLMMDEGIIRNM